MEVRYLNFLRKDIIWVPESVMLANTHLFANRLTVGGEVALMLQFDKIKGKLTTQQKINLAYSFTKYGSDNELNEPIGRMIEKYYGLSQHSANDITKDRSLFIAIKKIESDLLKIYNSTCVTYEIIIGSTLYPNMRQLMVTYPIGTELEEFSRIGFSNKKMNPIKEAEKILDFIFPKKTTAEPQILMLEIPIFFEFFADLRLYLKERTQKGLSNVFESDTVESYCKHLEETPELEELMIPQVLNLPPINHLNHLELLQLKTELKEPIEAFNMAVNKWIVCRKKFAADKIELANTYLDLIKAGTLLEDAWSDNPLGNTIDKGNAKRLICTPSFFFQIKLDKIWNCFEKLNLFQEDTIAALRRITANNPAYPIRIPVIGTGLTEPNSMGQRVRFIESDEEETSTRKKSIDLD